MIPSAFPWVYSQDLWSLPWCQGFTHLLQKGFMPPSSASKHLQVTLLGKTESFINTHNFNCCNLKSGFPLPGPWVCAAGVEKPEECFPAEPLR